MGIKKRYIFRFFYYTLFFFIIFFTNKKLGLTWDEAYYYYPSLLVKEWLKNLITLNIHEILNVDRYFSLIKELPPMGKYLLAISYGIGRSLGLSHILSLRWLFEILFILQLFIISKFFYRFFYKSEFSYYLPSLLMISFPRVFAHAHFGTMDLLCTFFILLSTYFFLKFLTKGKNLYFFLFIFTSVLGIITKFNNLVHFAFLCFILIILKYKKLKIHHYFSLFILPGILVFILWPWLWNAPIKKFTWYWNYFFHHQFTKVFFEGKVYSKAPFYYPIKMFFMTTPPIIIIAFIFSLYQFYKEVKNSFFRNIKKIYPYLIIFISAFYPMLLLMLPNAPTYDGIRLFLPAYPFLTMIISYGIVYETKKYCKLIYFFILIGFLVDLKAYYPFYMSYYNIFCGNLKKISKKYEITYWCEPFNENVIRYINNKIPKNSHVKFLAFQELIPQIYIKWGQMKKINIHSSPPYDYHILYNRPAFFGRVEKYLYTRKTPIKVFYYKEVPLILIYHTHREF